MYCSAADVQLGHMLSYTVPNPWMQSSRVPTHAVADCCVPMLQVWQLGNFGTDAKLNPLEVLVLMLTMTANELPTVISNMFRAFGGEGSRLETPTFMQLVTLLSKWDSSLTVQRCNALKESIEGSETLVFRDVKDIPVLQELLTPAAEAKAPES